MKVIAPLLNEPVLEKSRFAVYAELVKARLTALVLISASAGFYLGARGPVDLALMSRLLLGTALLAGGAAALNQWLERHYDARMRRTRERPLPAGRLQPATAVLFGGVGSVAGLICLALFVNGLTSVLGAVALVSYLFIYTPLKRVTWLNTAVGAVAGALPPLMGWAAARGDLGGGGWLLFALQAFWQMPHFLAIAWMYRDDYARAGFRMLPNVDPSGQRTAQQAVGHTLGLLSVSLCPFLLHLAGPVYLAGAVVLGGGFVWFGVQFARQLTESRARQLFFASIIYLPLLLALLVFDKVK